MKDLTLIVWLTQLGLTTAVPLVGFILLAIWLRDIFSLGGWILAVGIILGLICAIDGFIRSLKAISHLSKGNKGEQPPPSVAFNDHD